MWFVAGILLILATASAVPLSDVQVYNLDEADRYFEEFIQTHDRNYATSEEKIMRFEVFKNNLRKINERNAMRTQEYQAVHGITSFVDYTEEEFEAFIGKGLKRIDDVDNNMVHLNITSSKKYPNELDWRTKDKVTPIKDQGDCGSCWAFAAVSCTESLNAIVNNKLYNISEQQLVDCDKKSWGCGGASWAGAGHAAFARMGGAMLEKDYPYEDRNDKCRFDASKIAVKISGSKTFDLTNEVATIKQTLNKIGPASVSVHASSEWFTNTGGIIEGDSDEQPNHVVTIIGYGTYKGVDYWLLKNSWGTAVGDEGYYKIKAGENTCNIKKDGLVIVDIPKQNVDNN